MRISIQALLLPLIGFCPAAVQGAVSIQQCNVAADCVTTFDTSCEEVIANHDFADPTACCMSLTDTADGGCQLTVAPVEGGGGCNYATRLSPCTAGDFLGEVLCTANNIVEYELNFEGECPASDYVPKPQGESDTVYPLQLTLVGVANDWSYAASEMFISLTDQYATAFFNAYPNRNYTDVISSADIFNEETMIDAENDYVTLFYMQTVAFRSDDPENTPLTLLADMYNSEEGKAGYISILQNSNDTVLSKITTVFDLQVLQPVDATEEPEAVETTPPTESPVPGGAGASATQTHETATEAPTAAPEETVGVTVTPGEGELVSEGPEPSSAPATMLGFVVGPMTLVVSALVAW